MTATAPEVAGAGASASAFRMIVQKTLKEITSVLFHKPESFPGLNCFYGRLQIKGSGALVLCLIDYALINYLSDVAHERSFVAPSRWSGVTSSRSLINGNRCGILRRLSSALGNSEISLSLALVRRTVTRISYYNVACSWLSTHDKSAR